MHKKFISIEGLDGSGKSSIVLKIVKYLNHYHNIYNIITTHEPGGTAISDILRLLIKNQFSNESLSNFSELLMMYAARSQLLENVIKPSLSQGDWVISDRYDLSSHAYQGGGRKIEQSLLRALSEKITNNLFPGLIFYLDISPEISLSRIKKRKKLDRIEQESINFFQRVRACYQKMAALQSNIITINANQDIKNVFASIQKYLDKYLIDAL